MSDNNHADGIVESDIVFGSGGGRDLVCDIYHPQKDMGKRTALIHLHGGAWQFGGKEMMSNKAAYFAARGYVSIATQYRLTDEAKWPAQIEDVKACIRWTRATADRLGIEPSRIALVGYSAGAHLALIAAGTQNRPELEGQGGNTGAGTELAACFAYYPPIEIERETDEGDHWLMPEGSSQSDYQAASPVSYIGPDYPPTALFHGGADFMPIENSLRMFHGLRADDVPVELHIFEGLSHEFDQHAEFGEECAALCDLFLDRHVVNPRVYPPFQPGAAA